MAECKLAFKAVKSNLTGKTVHRIDGDYGTLTDTVYGHAVERSFRFMQTAWSYASEFISGAHRSGKFPFKDVTGNLYESLGVALIGKSQKSGSTFAMASFPASKEGFSASRVALGKGEMYNLGTYADGTVVQGKPYVGETDRGKGMRGKNERQEYLERIKSTRGPSRTRLYNLIAYAAMPYASYVNMKRGREYFQSVIMPAVVDGVKEAEYQVGR
jgi:hypothetical protein